MHRFREFSRCTKIVSLLLAMACHTGLAQHSCGDDAVCLKHKSPVTAIAFSPGGKSLASADHSSKIILWDIENKTPRFTIVAHTQSIPALAFSPSGRLLVSIGNDRKAKIWDVVRAALHSEIKTQGKEQMCRVHFSSDGRRIAIAGSALRVLEIKLGHLTEQFNARTDNVKALRFGKKSLLTANQEGVVRLFDMASGIERRSRRLSTGNRLVLHYRLGRGFERAARERDVDVNRAEISNDGRLVALAIDDKSIEVWDLDTRKRLWVLTGHQGPICSVAFSPDSKLLATGSGSRYRLSFGYNPKTGFSWNSTTEKESAIRVWDMDAGRELTVLEGHSGKISSLDFSPDGEVLTSGSSDKTIRLWDVGKILEDAEVVSPNGAVR